MALLTMLLTLPLIFIAYKKKKDTEEYLLLKLFGIWITCQLYVILNTYYRIPIGLLISGLIVYKSKVNKLSNFVAFTVGTLGFLTSSLIYIIFY